MTHRFRICSFFALSCTLFRFIYGSLILSSTGVIDLIGSHGGLVEFKAAQLASNGFAALALAYILHSDLPNQLEDVELEYFIEAVDWLKNHPSIIPGGVGVMGISKGAECSLLLASHCQDVKAVVSINGFYALSIRPMNYKKKPIPFFPADESSFGRLDKGAQTWRHKWVDDWTGSVEGNPKAIPVEKASASFLIIYGTDDHAYNTELSAAYMYNRLKAFVLLSGID
ncbi:Acyl-coenzyme A amino acid N-acyltransferase 1 [Exaiptasia diaphana]|nr:Acyl-coenzyme A amino acid N-acyltransferase 1 [Exaiptasia diaphana]